VHRVSETPPGIIDAECHIITVTITNSFMSCSDFQSVFTFVSFEHSCSVILSRKVICYRRPYGRQTGRQAGNRQLDRPNSSPKLSLLPFHRRARLHCSPIVDVHGGFMMAHTCTACVHARMRKRDQAASPSFHISSSCSS
jgi:hypothetical protein